ncbi:MULTISPECIES: fimbria/pilus outer membrane usher protein [unclassified Aeromonas]|uniref:fimbria/pilus outer membrane usher protein n=1 Tax=Aeromonas TaxID=642 RepID=UPI0035279279
MKQTLIYLTISFMMLSWTESSYAGDIIFNTDLLDVKDKESIESGAFKRAGYIIPGDYTMQLIVNNVQVGERKIRFYEQTENSSQLCLTAELASELGLKKPELKRLLASQPRLLADEQACFDPAILEGIVIKGEINKDTLTISVPQAYRDYASDSWDPPSRWDEGVNGALLDYGLNLQESHSAHGNGNSTNASAYGVAGINTGTWRLRADWQGRYQRNESQGGDEHAQSDFDVNRVYAYRALSELGAKLMVGEQDLGNSMFDGFQFTGASVITDDNMLPPNLRGYAPEVVGIAKTNAKVVISQQGRVIYETQVASGPFRIQDMGSGVSGKLDVKVEEQDGTVQRFQVNTANIPYLSRPGSVRYKFNSGKVSSQPHEVDGPVFASGEFSWGVSNGWSLLGGALLSDGYDALSIGVGRDLLQFGAISFDITESRAHLAEGTKTGGSYRVNYSKNFEEYDSQVAFAGYRFSERDFMNMNDFMAAKQIGSRYYLGGAKEMYSVVLSKQFKAAQLGAYIDYTHQSYWSQMDSDRISVSLSHYFDVMEWRGLTASLTAYRNEQSNLTDNGMYFTLSVPFGLNKHVSYSASSLGGKTTNSVSFFNRADERNSYSVTASTSPTGESASGFYTHIGDKTTLMANISHQAGSSTAAGLSINGGITATGAGVTMHRVGMMGGSRIMVDTDGVSEVPVHSGGPATFTDKHGKAVVADVSSYYRQRTSIDVDQLSDDAEPIGTPVSMGTLTEGAIGYRHFDMLSGSKRMLVLVKGDGKHLPFAAEVFNDKGQQLGMVGDEGMAYLAGLHEGSAVEARWGSDQHCRFYIPSPLPAMEAMARLTCQ